MKLCRQFMSENKEVWESRIEEEIEQKDLFEKEEDKQIRLSKVEKIKKKFEISSRVEEEDNHISRKLKSNQKSESWVSWREKDRNNIQIQHKVEKSRKMKNEEKEEEVSSPEEGRRLEEQERMLRKEKSKKLKSKYDLLKLCNQFVQENETAWSAGRLERRKEEDSRVEEAELEMRLRRASIKKVDMILRTETNDNDKRKRKADMKKKNWKLRDEEFSSPREDHEEEKRRKLLMEEEEKKLSFKIKLRKFRFEKDEKKKQEEVEVIPEGWKKKKTEKQWKEIMPNGWKMEDDLKKTAPSTPKTKKKSSTSTPIRKNLTMKKKTGTPKTAKKIPQKCSKNSKKVGLIVDYFEKINGAKSDMKNQTNKRGLTPTIENESKTAVAYRGGDCVTNEITVLRVLRSCDVRALSNDQLYTTQGKTSGKETRGDRNIGK